MLKLHIPARIGLLAALLSAASFADDRFVVKVNGDVNQVAQRNHLTVVKSLSGSGAGVFVLSAPQGRDRQQVLNGLSGDAGVQSAEPEKLVALPGVKSKKNSSSSSSSVQLDGTLVRYYDTWAPAAYVNQQAGQVISLGKAQGLAVGNGVKVAIIDTGIDRNVPELTPAVTDGYDFVNNSSGGGEQLDTNQETTPILDQETTPILDQETTPILDGGSSIILKVDQETTPILDQETTPILDWADYPAFGHGTMVAGLVHFVAPKAKLLAVRCFAANGTATVSQVVNGIYWAVDRGANVINASWSMTDDSPTLKAAVNFALGKGVIFVAAAGNFGATSGPGNAYPASYPGVIGVGSVQTASPTSRSTFSNYDSGSYQAVFVAAPGDPVVTVFPKVSGVHYAIATGTSFSAPLVAGTAALLVDISKNITPAGAGQALAQTDAAPGAYLGNGELDAYKACSSISKH